MHENQFRISMLGCTKVAKNQQFSSQTNCLLCIFGSSQGIPARKCRNFEYFVANWLKNSKSRESQSLVPKCVCLMEIICQKVSSNCILKVQEHFLLTSPTFVPMTGDYTF